MRDPDNIAKSYELEAPPAVIEMKDIPEYNFQDYDLADEKQFKKYIQNQINKLNYIKVWGYI